MSGEPATRVETPAPDGPEWLRRLVGEELAALSARGLPGMPYGTIRTASGGEIDAFHLTCANWHRDIRMYYAREGLQPADAPRLREGFALLATCIRRWPQSADLWPCIPPLPAPAVDFGHCGCGAPFGNAFFRARGLCFDCAEKAPQAKLLQAPPAKPPPGIQPYDFKAGLARVRAAIAAPQRNGEDGGS